MGLAELPWLAYLSLLLQPPEAINGATVPNTCIPLNSNSLPPKPEIYVLFSELSSAFSEHSISMAS